MLGSPHANIFLLKLTSVFISLICAIKTARQEISSRIFAYSASFLLFPLPFLAVQLSCLSFICRFAFISNIWRHILQIIFACIFARDSSSSSSRKTQQRENGEKTKEVFLLIFMGQEKSTIRRQTRCPQGDNAASSAHCVSLNYAQCAVQGEGEGKEKCEGEMVKAKRKKERRKCCR